jgi:hypothetical protein
MKTDRLRFDRHAAREQGRRLLRTPLLRKHDAQPSSAIDASVCFRADRGKGPRPRSSAPWSWEAARHFDRTISHHTVVPGLEARSDHAALGRLRP